MMKQKVSLAERLNIGKEVRELKLGYTFNSKNTTNAFHTIKYDFKPASVDRNRVATVDVGSNNQITVTVPNLESSGVPHTIYKGNQKKYTKECILIFDKKTGDITLEKLNHNIQVKKTRSEMTNKPSISSPMSCGSFNKLENSTMRVTSKTKVSTGNRRNTIIELKSRNSPLQRSPSSLSNCSKSPQAAPAWNANNGQSTLPSIPMIVDDDDDVVSCNNINNNNMNMNMNMNAVDAVEMMNTNYLANTSTSTSTSSHNSIQYDTLNQQQQQQENHQISQQQSSTNLNKPNTPNKYRNGNNNGKTSNHDSHINHKQRPSQKLEPFQQQEQSLQNQQQQVQQWQQQLQEQQRLQQQKKKEQEQQQKEQEQQQRLFNSSETFSTSPYNDNNSKNNGVGDFAANYQKHHYSEDVALSPTLASEAAALEMNIANTLSSSSSSSDSESSGSDSGTESDDSFEEESNNRQQNSNELNELPNLSLCATPASSPNQYQQKQQYQSPNNHLNPNNQHCASNYITSNGSNFPNDLLHTDLQLSSNSSDEDSD